jgi:hypothetical protein
MSRDDFHVVLYKVLTYLYECLKAGVIPRLEKAQELADVNLGYWNSVVEIMLENDYVTGIQRTRYKSAPPDEQLWLGNPRITEKGITYLAENSLMAKAKDFLGDVWPTILQTAVTVTKNVL